MTSIKDGSGREIARLNEISDHMHQIVDRNGRNLGYYNPKLNKTFTANGALVGTGDLRTTLIVDR